MPSRSPATCPSGTSDCGSATTRCGHRPRSSASARPTSTTSTARSRAVSPPAPTARVGGRFPARPDAPQTALSAIGQFDVAATPLQMAMVASGIANGGTVMRPYVVDEIRAPDLSVLDRTQPEAYRSNAISSSVARQLTQMMVEVVDRGTATTAQIPGVKVAGKTGTAQSSPQRPPYAWFVSFAPADNPQVAVAVLVEDAGVARNAISGSGLAAPIAKRVMQAVIDR